MKRRGGELRIRVGMALSAVVVAACAHPALAAQFGAGQPSPEAGPASESREGAEMPRLAIWRRARARLAAVRAEIERRGARTMRVSLAVREPYTGKTMEARGAVAIAPPHALRMIMLGPGGTTALDLWAKDDRFRFSVPALDLLRRGDAQTPRESMRGLPVEFLRWWLLRPAAGTLLWYVRGPAADRFILREDSAIVDLRLGDDGRVFARRSTWATHGTNEALVRVDEETVVADSLSCGHAEYRQASTGLVIRVRCEGVETERPPDPRAFEDPDGSGREAEP